MHGYSFDHIVCNGRRVYIDHITSSVEQARDGFESSLFHFMRQWLAGEQEFKTSTSGSTGPPKTIFINRHQMIESAQRTAEALALVAGQTALVCLHTDFIAGKMMIVRCLTTDLKIIAVTPCSNPFAHISVTIDFAALVPLQVHDLLRENNGHVFAKTRTVIVGGGALDLADVQRLKHLPCRCYATYGMTETVSHVALRRLHGHDVSDAYFALPGISFSTDARNCLIIHLDARDNTVTTNDVVELIDDKHFLWLGRWDNVINTGGLKVIPEKLEATIGRVLWDGGYRLRFFLAGIPDARLGTKMVMVVEGMYSSHNFSALTSLLKSTLQSHEVPKAYFVSAAFVLTETGKVDRNATLRLANAVHDSSC